MSIFTKFIERIILTLPVKGPIIEFGCYKGGSSAKTILKYMWPQLKDQGILFTHEAGVIEYIKGITDINWWENELHQEPPIILFSNW